VQFQGSIVHDIAALAATDGCARHPVLSRLTGARATARDTADAVHALCAIHGRPVTLFGTAARQAIPSADQPLLDEAETAFAQERAYLAALVAAVGPLPSTPGQAESVAAFAALRHTFDTLAASGRNGCAIGATIALMIDWETFRRLLDTAAAQHAVDRPANALPDHAIVLRCYATAATAAGVHRAIRFGAQQAFAQHRGLFDLIEARAIARDRL